MHAQTLIALLPLLAYATPVRRQNNLQPFNGALGGEAATPVEDSGNADRPFQVGADTFVNIAAALARSCDQQFNRCANLANGGGDVAFEDCNTQKDECTAASAGAASAGAGDAGNDNANANGNANNNANANGNANANANNNANANANANANDNTNANNNANATGNGNGNANANGNGNGNDNANGNGNANGSGNGNNNANANANAAADANNNAAGNANANAGAGGNDFGTCDPTMSLEGGRNGRPADELTFQSNDPAIEANQQEALNPNIITNRICDELGNICGANDAAIATCEDAQAQIEALGTRDQSTADAWNALVGGGAAKRSLRYGARRL
jgi:hypothetical protein